MAVKIGIMAVSPHQLLKTIPSTPIIIPRISRIILSVFPTLIFILLSFFIYKTKLYNRVVFVCDLGYIRRSSNLILPDTLIHIIFSV